ncbi:integral membrane protein, YjbE family [Arboricoccus pini]|uniref:Integral membrane protein, YjbE family n=1 Tax=Arboricoccus pini TaxID=1963835 RepID=A0A212QS42_9PROT|nr:TerC family protein [Arboricoccus pini]SNB62334.1 integral membrane protein, YjbE family [Arboricoccus pini]
MLDLVPALTTTAFWVPVLQIIWIDLLLSGDNAVVIAMACRDLPPARRRWGTILGAGVAITLRVVLAVFIVYLLQVPYLKLVGAALLLWIAVRLMLPSRADDSKVKPRTTLAGAILTIVVADAVMSLDNVIAIAAASEGNIVLLILGLLVSMPLIVGGSQIVLTALKRLPFLVILGAGILGWVAAEIALTDPVVLPWMQGTPPWLDIAASLGMAVCVVISGSIVAWTSRRRRSDIKNTSEEAM